MSFEGNRGGSGSGDSGIKGPARDAWNQPIKQEPQAGNGNNGGNGNGNGNNDPNNGGIDDATIDNIWSDIKKEKETPGGDGNNPPPPQQKPDPAEQLKSYLRENGLGDFVLTDADKEQISQGNFDGYNQKVLGLIQNAHVKAISSASALMDSKIAAAVEKATQQGQERAAGNEAVRQLNDALPFTKDKVIGPVAQSVMQRFINRGLSTEDAIKGVKKFFDHTTEKVGGPLVNDNRSGNFRGQNSNSGVNSWIDILSSKG